MIDRLLPRYRWQVSLAVLLTMLSVSSVAAVPALEWLGWLGAVGALVGRILDRFGGMKIGIQGMVVANVLILAAAFIGASWLVGRWRGRRPLGSETRLSADLRRQENGGGRGISL